MTNVSNPYLTVKAVAKKRLATPIALVCAFFGVAVAYSTVELFLRGETGSGVISCFLFAAVMTPVYRIFRHAYRKLSARRIAEALIPLSEESLTFDQLQTVLSSEKPFNKSKRSSAKATCKTCRSIWRSARWGCTSRRTPTRSGSVRTAAQRIALERAARCAANTATSR